jgi:hypothetical protein
VLSKDVGAYTLDQILSGNASEDVVSAIHEHLATLKEQIDKGEIPLEKVAKHSRI